MGQVLHGCATTTHAVRKAIQRSKASIKELSRTYGINPKTVHKWRQRQTVEDRKTGPKQPHSTLFNEAEEALIVAFRRHTLLPLDDCLYALTLPHLTRLIQSIKSRDHTASQPFGSCDLCLWPELLHQTIELGPPL